MSSSKSASRQPSVSKSNRHTRFNQIVRTLSGNTQTYKLDDIDHHHKINPRRKDFYKERYVFKTPYSTDNLAYQPNNPGESWTTPEEYKKAVAEKREEEFNFGRKWTVHAVKDDEVSICSMITGICKTISKTMFSNFFWEKTPIVGDTVTVKKGGKRTQKKRKFNTRKRRPKV